MRALRGGRAEGGQPVPGPGEFGGDALGEVHGRAGQHGPGVGLDLDVVADGGRSAEESVEDGGELSGGGAQRWLGIGVQRGVEVHPPRSGLVDGPAVGQRLAPAVAAHGREQGAGGGRVGGDAGDGGIEPGAGVGGEGEVGHGRTSMRGGAPGSSGGSGGE
ncbi:hypothetical protein [Streptomyces sp. A30]|uniref:hypothetical protein n=1 Tax=Streptomyces sp. A30 TaxID=2789273 RepID=UPI00397EEEFA